MQFEYLPINDLKPYTNNAREHHAEDVTAIMNSIREFGFSDPIGVWGKDNIIVEGHGRLEAAKKLRLNEVPVIHLDHLSDEQRRAYGLAHNRTAELSEWDLDMLDLELDEIEDIDMTQFGFLDIEEPEDEQIEPEPFENVEKMDTRYGVPYQGNKSRIADIIIHVLPEGKRLVDLFGGGGAITHCAMLSEKWSEFLYNDINPMITELFVDAIHGKYHDERRVITRDDFEKLKDTDAYVKYIWSFGNNGSGYLWGKDIEEIKCTACHALLDESLEDRRRAYVEFVRMIKGKDNRWELQSLEALHSLHRLEVLERLESLHRLEVLNISYVDYEYQDGDVVYCDVPYEQTSQDKNKCDDYGVQFDNLAFYKWCKAQPYQVFFSSYEISDDSFYKIKIKSVQKLIGADTNNQMVTEYLYSNMPIEVNENAD